jgi:hypothetical protein
MRDGIDEPSISDLEGLILEHIDGRTVAQSLPTVGRSAATLEKTRIELVPMEIYISARGVPHQAGWIGHNEISQRTVARAK